MVLKKSKRDNHTLFIDASEMYVKVGNINNLTSEHIQRIVGLFTDRADVAYEARLVPNDEVAEQNYNLSVSSYVEKEDTREVVDISQLNAEIRRITTRVNQLREEIDQIIAEIAPAGAEQEDDR
jgi:type I restriction enzyme M protein